MTLENFAERRDDVVPAQIVSGVSVTRRAAMNMIVTASTIAAAPAVATPIALAAEQDDPIFHLIEAHRAAYAAMNAATLARDKLDDTLPSDITRSGRVQYAFRRRVDVEGNEFREPRYLHNAEEIDGDMQMLRNTGLYDNAKGQAFIEHRRAQLRADLARDIRQQRQKQRTAGFLAATSAEHAACERESNLMLELFTLPATTVQGAAAALAYLAELEQRDGIFVFFEGWGNRLLQGTSDAMLRLANAA